MFTKAQNPPPVFNFLFMGITDYMKKRLEMKNKGAASSGEKKKEKAAKSSFFTEALKAAPTKCENCKQPLASSMVINPRTIVAHILAKRKAGGVPSMATNPLNKIYLCETCHHNYDNKGCAFIEKMKIYSVLRKRVVLMFDHIPHDERKNIPDCLQPSYGLEETAHMKK